MVECVYTEGDGEHARFAQPVVLGKNGIESTYQSVKLSAFEEKALKDMLDIKADIELGEKFING